MEIIHYFPPEFYLSGSYPHKKLSRNILGPLSLTIRLVEMNLLKPVTLIFLMRTALSEFSMDTTTWVCTTHCENEGKCGDNNFNDYLLPEPCSGDGKLQKYAGCDYRVCEKACANLTSTTINHTFESNIIPQLFLQTFTKERPLAFDLFCAFFPS